MTPDEDKSARRLALQLGSQLPEERERALKTLDYARELVEFMQGTSKRKLAIVTPLKPVG